MILVRNLYALLAFNMRDLDLLSDQEVAGCDFEKPHEVLAILLERATYRAFRRGIDRQYQAQEETGPRLRGTLHTARTIHGLLHLRGHLAFEADELIRDTKANQVLKAALKIAHQHAHAHKQTNPQLSHRLTRYLAELTPVTTLQPPQALTLSTKTKGPRGNRSYTTALQLATFILSDHLVDPAGQTSKIRGAHLDPSLLPALFEGFIRGFTKHTLGPTYKVSAKQPPWPITQHSQTAAALMPIMKTDVCIETKPLNHPTGQTTIIECKYYKDPTSSSAHSQTKKWHTSHLYQLLAYLQAEAATHPDRTKAQTRGLLAYAHHEADFDESFTFHGFNIRLTTIDLNQPWVKLRARVQDLAQWSVVRPFALMSAKTS